MLFRLLFSSLNVALLKLDLRGVDTGIYSGDIEQ